MQDNFKFGDDKEIVRVDRTILCRVTHTFIILDCRDGEQRRGRQQETAQAANPCISRYSYARFAQSFRHCQQSFLSAEHRPPKRVSMIPLVYV